MRTCIDLDQFQSILNSWRGTPYSSGIFAKGSGVNCIRFACSVLDDLCGRTTPTPVPNLPASTSQHNGPEARRVVAQMIRLYPSRIIAKGDDPLPKLLPGDVGVVRNKHNPAHIVIVGPHNRIWHSINGTGVCFTGLGILSKKLRIYRLKELS